MKYVRKHGYGDEIYNFLAHKGRFYGFVHAPGGGNIHIERLGAEPGADRVSNVTVVWAAKRPLGGVSVIGWYEGATVYSAYQTGAIDKRRVAPKANQGYCGWNITATKGTLLLPEDRRTFRLPVEPGLLGSSLICYLDQDTPKQAKLRQALLSYVASGGTLSSHPLVTTVGGKQPDPAKRKRVELAAVLHVIKQYESEKYSVDRVDHENRGWDLEASFGANMVRVEVKGSALSTIRPELTPNEYKAMKEHRGEYHICVLTRALTKTRKMARFEWVRERDVWEDKEGRGLVIDERPGAILTIR